jgi:RNA-directed DNA polymerase
MEKHWMETSDLIQLLNQKIRGWCNYYRHVVSKEIFVKIDCRIFKKLMQWIKRRHPNKNVQWRIKRYFKQIGNRRWVFYARDNLNKEITLSQATQVPIERYVKIKCEATPYNPIFKEYFKKRRAKRLAKAHSGLPDHLDKDGLRIARAV